MIRNGEFEAKHEFTLTGDEIEAIIKSPRSTSMHIQGYIGDHLSQIMGNKFQYKNDCYKISNAIIKSNNDTLINVIFDWQGIRHHDDINIRYIRLQGRGFKKYWKTNFNKNHQDTTTIDLIFSYDYDETDEQVSELVIDSPATTTS